MERFVNSQLKIKRDYSMENMANLYFKTWTFLSENNFYLYKINYI